MGPVTLSVSVQMETKLTLTSQYKLGGPEWWSVAQMLNNVWMDLC